VRREPALIAIDEAYVRSNMLRTPTVTETQAARPIGFVPMRAWATPYPGATTVLASSAKLSPATSASSTANSIRLKTVRAPCALCRGIPGMRRPLRSTPLTVKRSKRNCENS
jgi:hypothetical protein